MHADFLFWKDFHSTPYIIHSLHMWALVRFELENVLIIYASTRLSVLSSSHVEIMTVLKCVRDHTYIQSPFTCSHFKGISVFRIQRAKQSKKWKLRSKICHKVVTLYILSVMLPMPQCIKTKRAGNGFKQVQLLMIPDESELSQSCPCFFPDLTLCTAYLLWQCYWWKEYKQWPVGDVLNLKFGILMPQSMVYNCTWFKN